MVPSSSPSDVPSLAPSISSQPSFVPSDSPSTSSQPSDYPTHVDGVSGNFNVILKLQILSLSKSEIGAFERATSSWITYNDAESGTLTNVITTVLDQESVNITLAKNDETLRFLQNTDSTSNVEPALSIKFFVSAIYSGKEKGFKLFDELDPLFQSDNPMWIRELAKENNVFEPLKPSLSDIKSSEMQGSQVSSEGMAPGGMVSLSLFVVAATILAVAASVYSIRNYRNTSYGEELRSPVNSSYDEVDEKYHVSIGRLDGVSIQSSEHLFRPSPRPSKSPNSAQLKSPNSLERGTNKSNEVNQLNTENLSAFADQASNEDYGYPNNIQHFKSQQSSTLRSLAKDPPTAASEAGSSVIDFRPDPNHQVSLFDSQVRVFLYIFSGFKYLSSLTRSLPIFIICI